VFATNTISVVEQSKQKIKESDAKENGVKIREQHDK